MVLEHYKDHSHDMTPLIGMDTEAIRVIIDDFLLTYLYARIEGSTAVTSKIYPIIHDEIKEYYKRYQE